MEKHESLEAVHTPYFYETYGITLIALVITIVVLLILAGVTINLIFSDTGLFKKAQEAENAWRNAEQSDMNAIGQLANELNGMLNGTESGETTPEEPKEIEDITTLTEIQTENTKGKDIYGNIVMVPKGFKVVTSEGTTVPQGIVIEDGTGTENTTGNQFIWIPVGTVYKNAEKTDASTIRLGRYTFDSNAENDVPAGTPTPVQLAYTDENPTNYVVTSKEEAQSKNAIINSYFFELSTSRAGTIDDSNHLNDLNATAKNLAGFVQSVKNNGGYYIARYEASYGSGYNSEGTTDAEKYENAKPLSKASTDNSTSSMNYVEGTLWNFITQLNASKVCQNMYANDNTVGVESDLVNSYAWDTAIIFIQEMNELNSNYANKTDGNGTLNNTGMSGDKVCNIFDMSGNLREWTTEYTTAMGNTKANACAFTGGAYDNTVGSTSNREFYRDATHNSRYISFRSILYIN